MVRTAAGFEITEAFEDRFLTKCNDVTERYEKLKGRWTEEAQLFHIVSEVAELGRVLRNKQDKDGKFEYGKPDSVEYNHHIADEFADVVLTTMALANFLGLTNDQINEYVLEKLGEVERRVQEEENKHG